MLARQIIETFDEHISRAISKNTTWSHTQVGQTKSGPQKPENG
jgi:hypothetical protein